MHDICETKQLPRHERTNEMIILSDNWNVSSGCKVQSRNTNRSWIIEMLPGLQAKGVRSRRTFPFSRYVNYITERLLDSTAARKKSNRARRCTAGYLLVDAERPLNIHILAGVNFKILSWMSNFSSIASRARAHKPPNFFLDINIVKRAAQQSTSKILRVCLQDSLIILCFETLFFFNQIISKLLVLKIYNVML